ncbi:MAG: hypothetical protein MJZ29_11025 [Bacteroidaceae bacterium]|nr:hypothetical protein [Bacteroidaceae bacterium]
MKRNILYSLLLLVSFSASFAQKIDREALVSRNNPHITKVDTMASLNVGNGDFSFTADVTGLQSFPELYKNGVPLGTMSNWGWHSFPNTKNLRPEEDLQEYDFGHGHKELYATQFKVDKNAPLEEQQRVQRKNDAANYFRSNPHRLHLGVLGFDFPNNPWRTRGMKSVKTNVEEMVGPGEAVATDGKGVVTKSAKIDLTAGGLLTGIDQTLNMMTGELSSQFRYAGKDYKVSTFCNPKADLIAAHIVTKAKTPLCLRFPYPTGGHSDDACNWAENEKHSTKILFESTSKEGSSVALVREIDETKYYVIVRWKGKAVFKEKAANYFTLTPKSNDWEVSVEYLEKFPNPVSAIAPDYKTVAAKSTDVWTKFWHNTGVVDFSDCTDPRAPELERRVMLSQWLLATQCAGNTPPQETGLTYNSWFGKFHLEMIWWHQSWLALYNHPKKAANTLKWYEQAEPIAREIAERQGFKGVRWMKMTDPSATEAPSKVGSFLIWQQPHYIYLSELIKRTAKAKGMEDPLRLPHKGEGTDKVSDLIEKTAEFMADFATKEYIGNIPSPDGSTLRPLEGVGGPETEGVNGGNYRYVLKGVIAAQETLRASETVNPPFEVAYWKFALELAQKDRVERGLPRNEKWDDIINHLSPLKAISDDNAGTDSLYLASENALDTYTDERFTSDHMAVLGAIGILPDSRLVNKEIMKNTFDWIWDNWRWEKTWGWDHPMTAMCAARLGMPEKAVGALLMQKRTNTYLPNGHNYQDQRLRCYLPGNGGLLTAVALMCAGWDGCTEKNPGFPKDGKWNVKWENIYPMP